MATAISVQSTSSNKENGAALSPTSASKIKKEAQSLRRELARRTDERAQVELELLNAVDGLEEEKSALVDKLRAVRNVADDGRRNEVALVALAAARARGPFRDELATRGRSKRSAVTRGVRQDRPHRKLAPHVLGGLRSRGGRRP